MRNFFAAKLETGKKKERKKKNFTSMKGSPTGVLRIVLLSGLDIKCNRSRRRDRLENYFEYQPVKLRFINNRKKMRATFHFENFPVETFFMEV